MYYSHENTGRPDAEPTASSRFDEPLLLTVHQACRLLNCGRTKFFGLLTDPASGLEKRKLGRATRVTLASVRRFAATGTGNAGSSVAEHG